MKTSDKKISKESIRKILLIKQRNIGDVLLMVPTIMALREYFPKAYLAVLVNSGTKEMLTLNSAISEIIVFNRKWKDMTLLKRWVNEIGFVRNIHKKKFDMVIDLTEGDRGAILSFLSGAKYRLGFDPSGKGFLGKKHIFTHLEEIPDKKVHVVDYNLALLKVLGIKPLNKDISVYFSEEDEKYIEKIFCQNNIQKEDILVHIHPTSRWLFKCWETER